LVGVDFGIKELAVLNTGEVVKVNQKLKSNLTKTRKAQSVISKKENKLK